MRSSSGSSSWRSAIRRAAAGAVLRRRDDRGDHRANVPADQLSPPEVVASEPAELLDWWERGEQRLAAAAEGLTDDEFDLPSRLPGWHRSHVLAHLARNADALVNLLTWARTGVETPMYASPEARAAQITETAALPHDRLRAEVRAATDRLAAAMRSMPRTAWTAPVRTAQGRTVPAEQVPWMRCREVWVHVVDLDSGWSFADVPVDVLAALVDDVFAMWERRDETPDITVSAGDREWGDGSVTVTGPLPVVTAWLTGRSIGEGLHADEPLPTPPSWL